MNNPHSKFPLAASLSLTKRDSAKLKTSSAWQYYTGNKYIILGLIDDLVVYAELDKYQKYLPNKNKRGEQLQVWLRQKDQWLDIIEVNGKKIPRFILITNNERFISKKI